MLNSGQRSPTVLVVGWGFIGAAVGQRLLSKGSAVVGLTRSETPRTALARRAGARMSISDAADAAVLGDLVAGVDHVVFAAGGLTPLSSTIDPAREASAFLTPLIAVLEALRRHPRVQLTFISSGGTVYGEPAALPVSETAAVRPISQYGVACAAGEMYVRMYSTTFGVAADILRCSNVYGPGQPHGRGQGAVAVFLHRVARGIPIQVAGDGHAVRDYVHVGDVAFAVDALLTMRGDHGVVNVGSGEGHSVSEVLETVQRVVGREAVVRFLPPAVHDVQSVVLDIAKLRSLVAYAPVLFEEGVRMTFAAASAPSPAQRPGRSARHAHVASAG
jgi:UDP-glucose 4-epimerase